MSKQMDEFFRSNRQELDTEIPGDQIWQQLERRLTNSNKMLMIWKAAAVFFFLTTMGLVLLQRNPVTKPEGLQAEVAFEQTETFYTEQIKLRENWLEESPVSTTVDLTSEYDRLMAMYQVLKIQWEQHPTPEIRDALTLNLIVRLDLLTKQVDQQNRIPGSKNNLGSTAWN